MSEMDIVQGGAAIETATSGKKSRRSLPENCFACGAPVQGPFCHQCGQKNDDCRRSILLLLWDAGADLASLDGKVIRTLSSVTLRPGKHVREYGDGRRSPFSPPVRFFLVISFAFFTTMFLTQTHLVSFRPQVTVEEDGSKGFSVKGGFLTKLEAQRYTPEELDALRDLIQVDSESTVEINGQEVDGERLFDSVISIAENPSGFNNALNDWIPRLMIVMIPLMAILGALFIRGRDALIYDHLLLSLNTHAMAFLVLTISLVASPPLPGSVFVWAFFAGVPLYYVLGLKGAFKRGWFKTVFASLLIWFVYATSLTIGLSTASVISFTDAVR